MPFIDPINHQRDLRTELDLAGWDVEEIEAPEPSRVHSLWRLQSRWRPVGVVVHVAFIADPENDRRAYKVVVDRHPPPWGGPSQPFGISPNWDREKAGILAAVAALRS